MDHLYENPVEASSHEEIYLVEDLSSLVEVCSLAYSDMITP